MYYGFEDDLKHRFGMVKHRISKIDTPLLFSMCKKCEMWRGKEHDYEDCYGEPCFQLFLGYEEAKYHYFNK